MKSLTFQLLASFVAVTLAGVLLLAVSLRIAGNGAFDQLLVEQQRAEFLSAVQNYYAETGSFSGLEEYLRVGFRPQARADQPPPPPRQGPPGPPSQVPPPPPEQGSAPGGLPLFMVTDNRGIALSRGIQYRPGDAVPQDLIRTATPILSDGATVGYVVYLGQPPQRDPREQEFLDRTTQALVVAAVGATGVAVALGSVLALFLTRPIRRLTAAIRRYRETEEPANLDLPSATELRELVSAFNQLTADLAHANLLRRQMTADIAHELRTPLTVVAGTLEAIRDGVLPPTPERIESLYGDSLHLRRLVEDLRVLSLADAGELSLSLERVDLGEFFAGIAQTWLAPANTHGVSLLVEAAGIAVAGDRGRLTQIIVNLIANALRATPPGGTVTLFAYESDGRARFGVRDTGTGIPPDQVEHVFQRFYRSAESRAADDGGSGLGLAIVQSIVTAHGWSISVESATGTGTVMTIDASMA